MAVEAIVSVHSRSHKLMPLKKIPARNVTLLINVSTENASANRTATAPTAAETDVEKNVSVLLKK